MNKLFNIEIARGIAALLVVAFHAEQATARLVKQQGLLNFFSAGHAGVDFFLFLVGLLYFTLTYPKYNTINQR